MIFETENHFNVEWNQSINKSSKFREINVTKLKRLREKCPLAALFEMAVFLA